ncbi:hypothetical protein D3C73_983050 [compost metagenome]
MKDDQLIRDQQLNELGAIGIIRLGKGNVHIVFGTESEQIRGTMCKLLPNHNLSQSSEVAYD